MGHCRQTNSWCTVFAETQKSQAGQGKSVGLARNRFYHPPMACHGTLQVRTACYSALHGLFAGTPGHGSPEGPPGGSPVMPAMRQANQEPRRTRVPRWCQVRPQRAPVASAGGSQISGCWTCPKQLARWSTQLHRKLGSGGVSTVKAYVAAQQEHESRDLFFCVVEKKR